MFPVTITLNNPTELSKVLAALGVAGQQQTEMPLTLIEPKAEAKKPKATPAPQPVEVPAPTPAAVETPAVVPETAVESPSSVDYPTLQKAVFALAGKSRAAASEVVASFGVKTFKDLDQSKWGDALAAVNEKLAGL
jgi:outer membrane biosynthesis protein TonB